jgi:hypothetical protein
MSLVIKTTDNTNGRKQQSSAGGIVVAAQPSVRRFSEEVL